MADGIPCNSQCTLVAWIPTDCYRGAGESQLLTGARNTIMGLPCEDPYFLGLWYCLFGGRVLTNSLPPFCLGFGRLFYCVLWCVLLLFGYVFI